MCHICRPFYTKLTLVYGIEETRIEILVSLKLGVRVATRQRIFIHQNDNRRIHWPAYANIAHGMAQYST